MEHRQRRVLTEGKRILIDDPARLLDMVEGRSKHDRHHRGAPRRDRGHGSFHVVWLAGDALDRCRRRVQQAIHEHRGHKGDPLYSARRTLHTGAGLLTDKQIRRLRALFAVEEHAVHAATGVLWWAGLSACVLSCDA